jgi:hypothetical protein
VKIRRGKLKKLAESSVALALRPQRLSHEVMQYCEVSLRFKGVVRVLLTPRRRRE